MFNPPIIKFSDRVNFYKHLLQSEKELNDLPNGIIVALSYFFGILWQVKLLFTVAEAQALAVEYLRTGGQWMTEEEIEAAELWLSGHYPNSVPFTIVAVSSAMSLLMALYSIKRLFKDVGYLFSAIAHPFAKSSAATTKRNQRAFRAFVTILALILGAILIGSVGFSLALVDFASITMIAGLTSLGIATGFVPALIGALALAFAVGFVTHHLIRFYNAYQASWTFEDIRKRRTDIAEKLNINLTLWDKIGLGNVRLWFATMETNPLLRVKSGEINSLVAKRNTLHSYAKVLGIIFGILLFPLYLQLPILLPGAYFGYKVFNSILSDLGSYKNSGRNWGQATIKAAGLVMLTATLLLTGPAALATLIVGAIFAGFGFIGVVAKEIKKLEQKNQNSKESGTTVENDLSELIKRQTEVFQKAKYKLERDNLLSALITWPAKILAKHIVKLTASKNPWVKYSSYIGVLPIILTAAEMSKDIVLFSFVRPVVRILHFFKEIGLDLYFIGKLLFNGSHGESLETSAPYNQNAIKQNQPLSFGRFINRCFQHFKNLLNIINLLQGTEYQNKRNQNTWKAAQAKDTVEQAHKAIALQDGSTNEPEMSIEGDDQVKIVDKSNSGDENANPNMAELIGHLLSINVNREKWKACYTVKSDLATAGKTTESSDQETTPTHKSDLIEQTDHFVSKTCLNWYNKAFSLTPPLDEKTAYYQQKANNY